MDCELRDKHIPAKQKTACTTVDGKTFRTELVARSGDGAGRKDDTAGE